METREKVNINIRLGRQAFAGLAGAELPSFDHGPWKRVPRPQTVEVTDDHHESVEAEAADDRDGTPTLPSMEFEDPQADMFERRRWHPSRLVVLAVALAVVAVVALAVVAGLKFLEHRAGAAGTPLAAASAAEDGGLVVLNRPYFKAAPVEAPMQEVGVAPAGSATDAPPVPVPAPVLASAAGQQMSAVAPAQDEGPVTLRPIEPSVAAAPTEQPKAKSAAPARDEVPKGSIATQSAATKQAGAKPPQAEADTGVVFNDAATVVREAPAKRRGEVEAESGGQKIARVAAAQRLVAIKDDKTIVVHDPKSGVPKAVRVGESLPSGARLVEVNVSSGTAKTDGGTTLRLE